jgi:CMP-N-acetylneuraminic acid synthetase
VIPARGGSKGVPRKNIKLLAGKPLLQYTVEVALSAPALSKVVLNTDDEEIAAVGRELGLEVPFMRPAELALDNTPTLPVLQHTLQWFAERGETYDALCLLQPTSPLRTKEDIEECVKLMLRDDLDAVLSVLPVPHEYNPHWVYFLNEEGLLQLSTGEKQPIPRRQSLPAAYHREGAIYLTRSKVILEQNSLYGDKVGGYVMKNPVSINIDTMKDWEEAEKIMASLALQQQG